MEPLVHVFVYGTLKRGQCREHCRPIAPAVTRAAWTFGRLFDLGAYPAMLPGKERIAGECWSFLEGQLPSVLLVLDRIEGTNQPGQRNEYDRAEIRVTVRDGGGSLPAQTYLYASAERLERIARPMPAAIIRDGFAYAIWPEHQDWL